MEQQDRIEAGQLHFMQLNEQVRNTKYDKLVLTGVLGHRYIAAGSKGKSIEINGTPGNALGAYLDGSELTVKGNAQDATGDTMNNGKIVIYGSCGDTTGYGMRGGAIYIRDDAGYRAGIHMKEYKEHKPLIVIGGRAGSFLGEYQAGGIIVVLGIHCQDVPVGQFCGTGMHGGKIFIRSQKAPEGLPKQVSCREADEDDLKEIEPYIRNYCAYFDFDRTRIERKQFYILTPNTKNPYKQLYTYN